MVQLTLTTHAAAYACNKSLCAIFTLESASVPSLYCTHSCMLTVLLPHHAAAQQHAHTNRGVLKRFGGVMTLPDVYAVFNRARGTELISPLDLLTVSGMLGPLSLGMSLHTFPSGVAVIQLCCKRSTTSQQQ
eukprot:6624-Heterococcus_DN1.PRE.2